jgi:chromosome partitioning protein
MSLVAATHVLIPIQTEFKALKGTELLLSTIVEIIEVANKSLKVAGIVPTMFDSRTIQAQQSLDSIKQMAAQVGPVLSIVPRKTDFANASQERVPLQLYSPQNPAIAPLKEIADRLGEL